MNSAKVSIIIPCYNQGHFLNDALYSVQNQSHQDWECIIVNDGSTDNTEKIANQWMSKDSRFKYFYKTNGGLSSARNLGLEKMEGEYLLFLDSDDCIHKDKISKSIALLTSKKLDIVITDFKMFKKSISKLKPAFCNLSEQEFYFENILLNWDTNFNFPPHCCVFSSHLFKNLQFNESLKAKEDWFMWIEIFMQKPKVEFLNDALAFYRTHSTSMSKNKKLMRKNTDLAYIEILTKIEDRFEILFVSKIIEEKNQAREHYFKKYTKYRNLFYGALLMLLILIAATLFL